MALQHAQVSGDRNVTLSVFQVLLLDYRDIWIYYISQRTMRFDAN